MEVNTDPQKIDEVLSRGVVDVIERDHLRERMLKGEELRIKLGIDPTGPDLHIGRGATIKKLKEFQDLGHQIVLIIGDATARIGDSSDKDSKREMLTDERIKENEKKYLEQIGMILDINKVEVHHNSEWSDKFSPVDLVNLASLFTLQQMIERDNFSKRIEKGDAVGLHETLYPLLQGYDSVAIRADVEIGGTDQLFNILAGRKVQKHFGQESQDIMTLQLLTGTDGRKMSTSWGNIILVTEAPEEKFGKMMRLPDQLIPVYMESATEIPMDRVKEVADALEDDEGSPMEYKKELALALVELYDGREAAEKAQAHFESTIQNKELPESIPEVEVSAGEMDLKDFFSLLIKSNLIKSKSEGSRLLKEGAIYIDGESLGEVEKINIEKSVTVKVGKRRFLNLKVK